MFVLITDVDGNILRLDGGVFGYFAANEISCMESGKRCAENLLAVDEKRSMMLEPTPQMC